MKKNPDKLLKGGKIETKKPAGKEKGVDKGKKGQAERIRGGVRGKLSAVLQRTREVTTVKETETRAVHADVKRGGKESRKKKKAVAKDGPKNEPKTPARKKHAKPEVSAEGSQDTETVEDSGAADAGQEAAQDVVAGSPVDTTTTASEAEIAQKQQFERDARALYTPEQITELEQLGIPLNVAGSYILVIARDADGKPTTFRFWKPKLVKFFIDNKTSAERVKFYMYEIAIQAGRSDACTTDNIAAWAKHPELTIDILRLCSERFSANHVDFYADYFQKHPDFTWPDIFEYPSQFRPDDVAFLVYAGIKPADSLKHAELFSTERRGADLFNAEQLRQLQQGIVPPEVKIAYNRGGFLYTDKAILYFAEHRAKPHLVASYPKEFTVEDRVYCIENFVTAADIGRYPQWTKKYEAGETVKRVRFLVQHNADSVLSRQVFERYDRGGGHEEYTRWLRVRELVEAKKPLDQVLKYLEKHDIPAEYIIMYIDRGVAPETVHDYISKIKHVESVFICECAAAGMTADDAKPYWEDGFENPADAVVLWRGKTGSGTAKPYQRLFYENKYRETCEHNSSGAEIVRYVNEDVSPEVAALLQRADFTDDELSEAVAKIQRQKTRSKVFKIFVVAAAAALVALGIKYKGACGRNNTSEKETEDRGQPAAAGPVEAGREKPEQQYIRIPTSLCQFKFIPPKRVDLSCGAGIQVEDLVVDGTDKLGGRTTMKARAEVTATSADGVKYDCTHADFFAPANSDHEQLLDPVYDHMVCEPQQ